MKLHLKRTVPGRAAKGLCGDKELSVDISAGAIGYATFACDDIVSAELELTSDEVGREYFLQIGGCPDKRPYLSAVSHAGVFKFELKPDRNSKDWHSFPLFRSTIGKSLLFLGETRYDADVNSPLRRIAEINVIDETRSDIYDKMVRSLLDDDLPHFCLDDFHWQMLKNRFSLSWEDGYTSYQNSNVMLMQLRRVIKCISPYFASILRAPQMSFQRNFVKKPLAEVNRIDTYTRKAIYRQMLKRGESDLVRMQNDKILITGKRPTYDIPAHQAIKTFLKTVKARLFIIETDLDRRLRELQADVNKKARVRKDPRAKNIIADDRAAIDGIVRKQWLCRRVRRIVVSMLSSDVMRNSSDGTTIFDVAWASFSATEAYRKLYESILRFSRSCYWWVGDKQIGAWRVPTLRMADNGMSLLQHKYSTVYENWCYAQLLKGFFKLGFTCVEGQFLPNENGSRCKFVKGEVEVTLIHGVRAMERSRYSDAEFEDIRASEFGMTPDYAMIIRERGRDGCVWAVLDAKSDPSMREHMLKARNKYAGGICYVDHGSRVMPFASILLRSGECDSDYPEIEIPPPKCEWASGAPGDEYRIKDHSDADYRWDDHNGIVEGANKLPPYHGHLRVNVKSLWYDEDIFQRFVCGMVVTARRELAKKTFYRCPI